MAHPLLVMDVVRPIPYLNALPGDRLLLRPSHPESPFVLFRDLPDNYALTILSDDDSVVCASGPVGASPAHRPTWRGPRGTLRLEP